MTRTHYNLTKKGLSPLSQGHGIHLATPQLGPCWRGESGEQEGQPQLIDYVDRFMSRKFSGALVSSGQKVAESMCLTGTWRRDG